MNETSSFPFLLFDMTAWTSMLFEGDWWNCTPLWIAAILLLLTVPAFLRLIIGFVRWRLRLSPVFSVPGPTDRHTSFVVGEFPTINREPFFAPQQRWWKQAIKERAEKTGKDLVAASEDVKMIHYCWFFGRFSVVVLDPNDVQRILTSKSGNPNPPFYKDMEMFKPKIGDGLVTLDGPEWRRHRHIVQPAFVAGVVQSALAESVPSRVRKLKDCWKLSRGRELEIAAHLSALTLDIIGDVGFLHEFHGLDTIEEWAASDGAKLGEIKDPLMRAFVESFKPSIFGIFLFVTGLNFLNRHINPTIRHLRRSLDGAVDDIIARARKDVKASLSADEKASYQAKSVLHLLLKAQMDADSADAKNTSKYQPSSNKALMDNEICDEIKTFIIAGHETTSTWCYWMVFAMVKYPDVQDRVFQDIEKHADRDGELTWDVLERMEYLHGFMVEVLRLYPPAGLVMRSNRDTEVLGGIAVPPHARVIVPIHLLHRHPAYWDDAPEDFRPERWIECGEKDMPYKHRFAFLPFSAGSRNCIGQRFATVEAKMIMASLVRDFVFSLAPSQRDVEFTFTTFVTLKTKPGLKVCVSERKRE